jgi:superoxide dismutase, Fe-Mn family
MNFQLRPLSLDEKKLTGLSEKLIVSHHENNYAGAVKRLNAIRGQLSDIVWETAPVFQVNGLKREELVAANSAYLHELYFDVLGGDGVLPSNGFRSALIRDFGSYERWHAEFTAMAKAMGGGSGWALLSWLPREGKMVNHWASDHTQLLAGGTPVLALDMYEHAYHLDYGAKAAAYVDAFMQNIQWDAVYRFYGAAVAGSASAFGTELSTLHEKAVHTTVLDVRRPEHRALTTDTIAGAVWFDPAKLPEWSQQLDASKPVVVCCVHGLDIGRSTAVALRARGFDATYLVGGIEAWRASKLPMEPQDSAQEKRQ